MAGREAALVLCCSCMSQQSRMFTRIGKCRPESINMINDRNFNFESSVPLRLEQQKAPATRPEGTQIHWGRRLQQDTKLRLPCQCSACGGETHTLVCKTTRTHTHTHTDTHIHITGHSAGSKLRHKSVSSVKLPILLCLTSADKDTVRYIGQTSVSSITRLVSSSQLIDK